MTRIRDGVWLALCGAACWGAPALPKPLAWGLGAFALAVLVLVIMKRSEEVMRVARAGAAVAFGVVFAHVVGAGPLPTDDAWPTSPAALASLAASVAGVLACRRDGAGGVSGPSARRELLAAAALTLLLLALVPLGLLPLGFSLDLSAIWPPLAAAGAGLAAGLAMLGELHAKPPRALAWSAAALLLAAGLSLAQVGTTTPLMPPSRQPFPAR